MTWGTLVYAGLVVVGIMVLGYALAHLFFRGARQFIASPRGNVPVPSDDELLGARQVHAPEHGYTRLNGDRWCQGCGRWTKGTTWVTVQDTEGNKVAAHGGGKHGSLQG